MATKDKNTKKSLAPQMLHDHTFRCGVPLSWSVEAGVRPGWMRSDLKFHRYTLIAPQSGIGPLLDEVARDLHACFSG